MDSPEVEVANKVVIKAPLRSTTEIESLDSHRGALPSGTAWAGIWMKANKRPAIANRELRNFKVNKEASD